MSTSITSTIEDTTTLENAGSQSWYTHISDQLTYLLTNATLTDIPDNTFALYKYRPYYLLRELGVDEDAIEIVIIINEISRTMGFKPSQKSIYIPTDARMDTVKNNYPG